MHTSPEPPDQYLSVWNPQSYLRQFYSTPTVPDDTQAVLQFLFEQLQLRKVRGGRALEFGCGPTIWGALPLTSFVDEIHLADYLPSNLAEVNQWLQEAPNSHDWSVYMRYVLTLEGHLEPTARDLSDRAQALRDRISALCRSDIFQNQCVDTPIEKFDVVTSFYCLDCIQSDIREWRTFMQRLSNLVAPGGHLILASILGSGEYLIEGRKFPVTPLKASDFHQTLLNFGFREDSLVIRSVPIEDWKDEGFDQIGLVAASKQ